MNTLRPSSKITLSGLVDVVTVVSAALGAYYALTESMDGVRDDVREMNRRAGWLIRRRGQEQ